MFASTRIAIIYGIFALIATAANIGTQELVIGHDGGVVEIWVSVLAGTGVGLLVKYVLDKRDIFRFRARDALHDTRTFALYTVMGLATTLIFWGFEFGFQHFFESKPMRYLGGVIGLGVGYLVKYRLDKRFVFGTESV